MKFGFCVSENDDLVRRVGWEPYSEGSVSVIAVTSGPHQVVDFSTRDAYELIDLLAESMMSAYNVNMPLINECVVIVSPEHCLTLSEGGIGSKQELARLLFEATGRKMTWKLPKIIPQVSGKTIPIWLAMSFGILLQFVTLLLTSINVWKAGFPKTPKFTSPASFHIIVAGGAAGKFTAFCPGFGIGLPPMATANLSKCCSEKIVLQETHSNNSKIELDPCGERLYRPLVPLAIRNERIKTIGILDISKPGATIVMKYIVESIERLYPMILVRYFTKPTFSRPATDDLIQKIAEQCNAVIVGLAD